MSECIWTWEQDSRAVSVRICAREDSASVKFIRGEDAVALEVPYDLTVDDVKKNEELRKKFAEVLALLLSRRK